MADAIANGVRIRDAHGGDVAALTDLWHEAGLLRPWNEPAKDIALCADSPGCRLLVAEDAGGVAGSVMAGSDGHRGWVHYLAVAARARGAGLGTRLLRRAEICLREQGIAKVQLIIREENAGVSAFYRRAGYSVEPRMMMSRTLESDP